jgi:hypothetical protein
MSSFRTKTGRMSYRRWALSLLLSVLGVIGLVILINCTVDAYGILRTDFSRQFQEPNENFIKMKYLLGHKDKYDSFLFGSSRALQIDTKKMTDGAWYNMAYSEGLPNEFLDTLKFMLREGVRIRNVMIALDEFSFVIDPGKHTNDLMRQAHYRVSGKRPASFYSEYFVKIKRFIPSIREYLRYNYTEEGRNRAKRTLYDFYDSGRVICTTCDDEIEQDIEKHRHDPRFEKPIRYYGDNLANTLASLREIVALARERNFRLTLFIDPVQRTTYLGADQALLLAFKQDLAGISDYYDFSGLNTITTDNYYYHETSHFRHLVGDMMLRKMFGAPEVVVPADFGVLVTSRNVDGHVRKQREQLEAAGERQAKGCLARRTREEGAP